MLRALLFDLDNTLVDRNRAFRDCVWHQFSQSSVRAELMQLDGGGHGNRDVLFDGWVRHGGTSINQQLLGSLIAARLTPDADLLGALRALSKRLKLGIITNGASDSQRRKWSAAGLPEVIPRERVWVSAEVGMAKPDPNIFLLASRALGEAPEHCLYVGDYEPHDRAGATAAGMRARLVDAVLNADRLNALLNEERQR